MHSLLMHVLLNLELNEREMKESEIVVRRRQKKVRGEVFVLAVEINPLARRTVFVRIFGRSEPKSILPALFFHLSTSFVYLFVFNRSSKRTLKLFGGGATPV